MFFFHFFLGDRSSGDTLAALLAVFDGLSFTFSLTSPHCILMERADWITSNDVPDVGSFHCSFKSENKKKVI